MTNHIPETPEMVKTRKAKAALKNATANILETLKSNEEMSAQMLRTADDLEKYANAVGDKIYINIYNVTKWEYESLAYLLEKQANLLRKTAV